LASEFSALFKISERTGTMSDADELAYKRTFVVKGSPELAFNEFTNGQGGWWPHDHRRGKLDVLGVVFEPRVGGSWSDRVVDGSRVPRGKVLVWDPPRRVVVDWPFAADQAAGTQLEAASELDVYFYEHGSDTTRVDLEHRGMHHTHALDLVKEKFFSPYGWDLVVANFTAYLASYPWLP
jgi:uncharacterized protein YndB with AHSA1/START domain